MDELLTQNNTSVLNIHTLITELGHSHGSIRQDARNRLVAMGSAAVPALISALSDCHEHVRWEAARVLGRIHDPSSARALIKALDDRNVDVRWAAANSLIKMRRDAVAPLLIALVRKINSIWLREGARYVLRQLDRNELLDPPAVKVLNALNGPAPDVLTPWAAKSALEIMQVAWVEDSQPKPGSIKMETDIPMGAEVICSDGGCGKLVCVLLNPVTEKVTHLVVKEQKQEKTEYVVPLDQVIESSPASIYIYCKTVELEEMQPFKETEFLPNTIFSLGSTPSMLWPYDAPGLGAIVLEHEHIPPDELAVHRGARVIATDGEVGKVDEFLIDPENGHITHLILREGHLWDQEDVTIPVAQIEHIEEDAVYLKIDKCAIEALPAIPLRRRKQAK